MFDSGTKARAPSADQEYRSTAELLRGLDATHRRVGACQREFLAYLAAVDETRVWRDDECSSMAHWVAINYGISSFKAARMVAAGHALRSLPRLSKALADGVLSLDKVLELARFATPQDEAKLIAWARRVSVGAVRDRADEACRIAPEQVAEAERARRLEYWNDPDGMFGLYACLPPDKGAKVRKAIERAAARMSVTPEDDGDPEVRAAQKRADALVALASQGLAHDPQPDRATVVVHVPVRTLSHGDKSGVLEAGYVIAPEVARSLCCHSRMQFCFENEVGRVVGNGRARRTLSPHLSRALRRRDGYRCTFPGCGAKMFLTEHHIDWWGLDGHTDLDRMVLVCPQHHDLIHKHGWNVRLKDGVEAQWLRPDGSRFLPGRSPPDPLASRS